MEEKQYEPGLYQYDGMVFRKIEPSGEAKIPVTDEAMEAIKVTRKAAQVVIGMRPELSLVASAMILEAAKLPTIAESVKSYGQRVYSSAVAAKVEDDTQQHQATPAEAQAKPTEPVSAYL